MELAKISEYIDNKEICNVGLLIENELNEILIEQQTIIGKQEIVNIPSIKTASFNSKDIRNKIIEKYNISIYNINKYISKTKILNENCDEETQVNLYIRINKNQVDKNIGLEWKDKDYILSSDNVAELVKQNIEICDYNEKIICV